MGFGLAKIPNGWHHFSNVEENPNPLASDIISCNDEQTGIKLAVCDDLENAE